MLGLLSLLFWDLTWAADTAQMPPDHVVLQRRLFDDLILGRDVTGLVQTLRRQHPGSPAVPEAPLHTIVAALKTQLDAFSRTVSQVSQETLTEAALAALQQGHQQLQAAHMLMGAHLHGIEQRLVAAAATTLVTERQQNTTRRYEALIESLLAPLAGPLAQLQQSQDRPALAASTAYQQDIAQALQAILRLLPPHVEASPRPVLRVETLPARSAQLVPRRPRLTPTVQPSYSSSDLQQTAPTSDDLSSTSEAPLHEEILAQAQILGHDYIRIYEFVRNETATQWYAGAMKGALGTLRQKSGNAVDQASLLIALLRASGAPARYVHGVIRLPMAQAINSLGLSDTTQVLAALTAAGVAHAPVLQGGRVAAVDLESTWVAAYVPYTNYRGAVVDTSGPLWIPFMPALKTLRAEPSKRILHRMGLSTETLLTEYLAQPQDSDLRTQLEQAVSTYLQTHSSDETYVQQLGSETIIPLQLGLLPTTLPVTVLAVTAETASLAEDLCQRVRFVARAGGQDNSPIIFDVTMALAEVAGERLTLSYLPATVDDQRVTHLYGGLDYVPAYLIKLRPQLKRKGHLLAIANADLDAGASYRFEMHLLGPAGAESVHQTLIAGSYHAIGLSAQEGTPLRAEQSDPTDSETLAAALLYRLAHEYSAQWTLAERDFSGLMDVTIVRPWPAVAIVSNALRVETLFGQPHQLTWEGVTLDAALRLSTPFAREPDVETARSWLRLNALQGSILEHQLFEQLLLVQSISAEKGLQLARARGDVIHRLEPATLETLLPSLHHPAAVLEHIATWVRRGMTVDVPSDPIRYQAWQGSVWRVEDPGSGAAGYFITGGLAGGATSEDPTLWALELLRDAFRSPNTAAPNRDPHSAASIEKNTTTDGQAGEVDTALANALAVLVRDAKQAPVKDAMVTFTILTGEGCLQACPQPAASPPRQVEVPTDARGIASVKLILGQKTSVNAVYVQRQAADEHLTQAARVLVNASVPASAGRVLHIRQPFTALAYPQAPDRLQFTSTSPAPGPAPGVPGGSLLTGVYNGWIQVRAIDRYENPVSNVTVEFTSPSSPLDPENDCPFTPTFVVGRHNRDSCPAVLSAVSGECGSPHYIDTTTVYGVLVGLIPARGTRYDTVTVSSAALPPLSLTYTVGPLCREPEELQTTRVVYPSADGDNLHAARIGTGSQVPVAFTLYKGSMKNGYRPHQAPGRVEAMTTTSGPDGTCVSPNPMGYQGHGRYATFLRTDVTPRANEISARIKDEVGHTLSTLPLSPVTGVRLRISGVAAQGIPPELPPDLVYLDTQNRTPFTTHITYTIEPVSYQAASVDLDIFADGLLVKVLPGSERHGVGRVVLLQQELFDPLHAYTMQLVLNRGTPFEIRSRLQPFPLRAKLIQQAPQSLHVAQDVDIVNERSCVRGTEFTFTLSEEARVSLVFAQKQDGQATAILLDKQIFPPGTHTVPLFVQGVATSTASKTLIPGQYRYALTAVATNTPPADTLVDPNEHFPILPGCPTVDDPEEQSAPPPQPPLPNQDAVLGGALVEYTVDRLPVGRTLVQDVDIASGNLIISRTDVQVPGRGVPLEFRRTYSDNSSNAPGALGIGWSHSYQGILQINTCGDVLVTSDVGVVRFERAVSATGQSSWQPLKGYHGTLQSDGSTGTFDFYSTNGTRYHFGRLFDRKDYHLAYIQDPNGNVTRLGYDPDDTVHVRLLTVEDAARRTLTFTYEERAFDVLGVPALTPVIISVKGPDDLHLSFAYDDHGNLISAAREGQARVETYAYQTDHTVLIDPNTLRARLHGRLTSLTNPNGATTIYEHQPTVHSAVVRLLAATAQGQQQTVPLPSTAVTGVQTPARGTTHFQYDVPQRRTTVLNGRGFATVYTRNAAGAVIRIDDPVGGTSTTSWREPDVVPASRTNARGVMTAYTYDVHGNVLAEQVDTVTTTYTYTLMGNGTIKNRVATITNRNGNSTRFEYDPRGNLLRMVDAAGSVTEYTYALNGDRLSSRDPNGNVTHYGYDRYGNLSLVTDALGGTTRTTWNSRSLPTSRTDALGRTTSMVYDRLGRLIQRTDPLGQVHTWHYDAMGNLLGETDEAGRTTSMQYDAANRLIALTSAAGNTRTLAYDEQGNKLSDTDYRGHATAYTYDPGDRLIHREAPLGRVTTWTYDPVGNMLSETDALGRQTTYTYDTLNRRLTTTDALGGVNRTRYDGVGNVLAQTNANGHTTTMTYDSLDRLLQRQDPLGALTAYEYDANGNRSAEVDARGHRRTTRYDTLNRRLERVDALGNSTRYEYDAVGNLIREINARLHATRYEYDHLNRRTKIIDPAGFTFTYAYDPVGNRVTESLPNGNVLLASYDVLNRLTQRTDRLGLLARYVYDADGNRLTETDANGNTTYNTYDALNQLIQQESPAARHRLLTYDLIGNLIAETDPNNNTTLSTYDARNRQIKTTDPLGYTVTRTYDAVGNTLTETNQRDHTTTFVHDARNRLVQTTDPLGLVSSITYDPVGNTLSETDKRGLVTTYTYDRENRLLSSTRGSVLRRILAYDAVGNLAFETDANGNTSAFLYDPRNLRVRDSRPLAAITEHTYDATGNRLSSRDPEGHRTTFLYDLRHRLLEVANGANETTTYTYDGNGNRLSRQRPGTNTWTYTYDAANRLTAVADPVQAITRYTYDGNGNRLTQTDANGNAMSFTYDALNRLTGRHHADGATAIYTYDAAGNRLTETDPSGQTVRYTYDVLNRLSHSTYDPPVIPTGDDLDQLTYTYDGNNNILQAGETYSGATGTRLSTRTYDQFERLLETIDPDGQTIRSVYDSQGNRLTMTAPDGRVTQYTYDALHRMTSVITPQGVTEYTYDRASRLTRTTYPTGTTVRQDYDAANRVTRLTHLHQQASLATYAYTYDVNGNRTAERVTQSGENETITYAYDAADRLQRVAYPDHITTYSYDGASNRRTEQTARTADGQVLADKTYNYNARNQVTSITDQATPATDTTYTYDETGNRTAQTSGAQTTTYVYDVRHQLRQLTRNGTLHGDFHYDWQGLRVRKATSIETVRYVYDGPDMLLVTDDTGPLHTRYTYGDHSHPLILEDPIDGPQYTLPDALRSVVALNRLDGSLQERSRYDAWGQVQSSVGHSTNRLGFTGHEYDRESSLYYAKARYYDPMLGLFLSPDLVLGDTSNPLSLHPYLYAYANPTGYLDPDGRQSLSAFIDQGAESCGFLGCLGYAVLKSVYQVSTFGFAAVHDPVRDAYDAGRVTAQEYYAYGVGGGLAVAGLNAATGRTGGA